MTVSQRKEIVEFCQQLPELRQQVDDRGLLDRCQSYLGQLLELSKDDALDPDSEPASQSQ
jgi:hypothetical protein